MRIIRIEATFVAHHFVRNVIGGSGLITMPVRAAIWRLSGLKVRTMNIREGCLVHNSYLDVARGAVINRGCFFEGSGPITVAEDVWTGPECAFLTSHHDYGLVDGRLVLSPTISQPIHIGARVWVGARVTFLSGAYVEDDVILMAGSVVRGRCGSGWVYGGVPARPLVKIGNLPAALNPE